MDTQHASAQTVVSLEQRGETQTHLYGRRLVFARVVWGVIALLTLGLLIASIPTYFASLHVLCTSDPITCRNSGQLTPTSLQAFRAAGISLDFYATYEVALYILLIVVFAAIGAVIFWRRSDDRMALVASLALVTFPAGWGSSELATLLHPGGCQVSLQPSWAISLYSSSSTCFLRDALSRVGRAGSGWPWSCFGR